MTDNNDPYITKEGVWTSLHTSEGRFLRQTPKLVLNEIKRVKVDGRNGNAVIEIGPSEGYTSESLLSILPEAVDFYGVEANRSMYNTLVFKKKHNTLPPRFFPILGNGWSLKECFAGERINGNVKLIISANALGIATSEKVGAKYETTEKSINKLLDDCLDLLAPSGLIIITVGSTGLIIRLTVKNGKKKYLIEDEDWIEDRRENEEKKLYKTHVFDVWIDILKKRQAFKADVASLPKIPTFNPAIGDFNYFRFVPVSLM